MVPINDKTINNRKLYVGKHIRTYVYVSTYVYASAYMYETPAVQRPQCPRLAIFKWE